MSKINILRRCSCGTTAYIEEDLCLFVSDKTCIYGKSNLCKKCKNKADKKWRESNSEKNKKRTAECKRNKRQENKLAAVLLKGGKCAMCSIQATQYNLAIFDFHHIYDDKDFNPANIMVRKWELIEKEIDKCILVCANCHRLIHSNKELNNG